MFTKGAVDVCDFAADTAPQAIELFATGIREGYDLCWHSRGSLFAGINMNNTNDMTPGHEALPSISARPAEMMLRIVRGKYYGHPNPARDQWVFQDGNPTAGVDPWEVPGLPVGTMPERTLIHRCW